MSYKRLGEKEAQLKREVAEWFKRADAIDQSEDREERKAAPTVMPQWVANKQARIERIREAKAALEAQAKAQGKVEPKPRDQYNFTDPQSAMMKGPDSFVQAYNAQAVVDADSQVIVAQALSDRPTDVTLSGEMVAQIKSNNGWQAREFSADAGYYLEGNLAVLARRRVRAYVATGKQRHGTAKIMAPFGAARPALRRCAGVWHAGVIGVASDCASKRSSRCSVRSSKRVACASS